MKEKRKLSSVFGGLLLAASVLVAASFLLLPKKPTSPEADPTTKAATEAFEETRTSLTEETATEEVQMIVPVTREVAEEKGPQTKPLMRGIDVSKWQGKPDWAKIAESGVEFAMIRIGARGTKGSYIEDPMAEHNFRSADENGILTGAYFYSLAKSEEDAREEAEWVLERIGGYNVSLPVVIDYEMKDNDNTYSPQKRTDIALAFLKRVEEAGYEGMLYVPVEEFFDPALWEKDRVLSKYKVWGADYKISVADGAQHPDGKTCYAMWQYSNTGRVEGIRGNVDLDFAYFTATRKEK